MSDIDKLMATPDEQILAEARAQGMDVDAEVARSKALVAAVLAREPFCLHGIPGSLCVDCKEMEERGA